MSHLASERLYNLLPAVYRQRDGALGGPLRALLAVMEQEFVAIEEQLGGLYDDWFIETCQERIVPYIGDLLGVHGLTDETAYLFSQRSHVANAIAYRRRKGLPAILERVAQDVTGWNAHAVEYFNLLGWTQHLHNVHLKRGRTFSLRDKSALTHLNDPFNSSASLLDVRSIAPPRGKEQNLYLNKRGKYHISNLGIFLWRLESYPITNSEPGQVEGHHNCYTFHPLGVNTPLFNQPQAKTGLTQRTEPRSVPSLLTRQALHYDLEAYRQALADNKNAPSLYFDSQPVLRITDNKKEIKPNQIGIGDLSDWSLPVTGSLTVIVDPELGRMRFFETPKGEVRVSYAYGFSANIGGGPYDRRQTLAVAGQDVWRGFVAKSNPEEPNRFKSIEAAIEKWQAQKKDKDKDGIILITDNSTYDAPEQIDFSKKRQLVIQAADGRRPCLKRKEQESLRVLGDGSEHKLTLNGLLIEPKIHLEAAVNLNITHSTLISGISQQANLTKQQNLQITISHSLLGPISLSEQIAGLTIQDSVIDGDQAKQPAIAANEQADNQADQYGYGPPTTLKRATLFGEVRAKTLSASEVIFTEEVKVKQRQIGNVRFSYIPSDSDSPQRYRCQPDLAIAKNKESELSKEKRKEIQLQLQPRFTSTEYGQPGYAQLSQQCATELTSGAENQSEMGAFQHLLQPQRQANLKASLNEYLPTGLEAGIFYVT